MKHVKKPWGSFDQYTLNERSTVKIITLNPGASTSLQSHKHRKELWLSLDNGICAQIGKKKVALRKGSSILVKKNAKHRLECEGTMKARLLEISFGKFSERDIVRYEDKYGRISQKVSQ